MWIITPFGFFSIVQKKKADEFLTIRARARGDLVALKKKYLPAMSEIIEGGGTDYQFRARAGHEEVGDALAKIAKDINYANFKNTVHDRQGKQRADTYSKVWSVLWGIKDFDKATSDKDMAKRKRKKLSYGGVVFDKSGRVLLRKVTNGFGGADWTFAKGGATKAETAEETALREVKEECGADAKILARVPGLFEGTTSMTGYFVMEADTEIGPYDKETCDVEWLPVGDAKSRIEGCKSIASVKKRDLAVLEKALARRGKMRGETA